MKTNLNVCVCVWCVVIALLRMCCIDSLCINICIYMCVCVCGIPALVQTRVAPFLLPCSEREKKLASTHTFARAVQYRNTDSLLI